MGDSTVTAEDLSGWRSVVQVALTCHDFQTLVNLGCPRVLFGPKQGRMDRRMQSVGQPWGSEPTATSVAVLWLTTASLTSAKLMRAGKRNASRSSWLSSGRSWPTQEQPKDRACLARIDQSAPQGQNTRHAHHGRCLEISRLPKDDGHRRAIVPAVGGVPVEAAAEPVLPEGKK